MKWNMKWTWTVWLLAIIASFAFFEGWALTHNTTTLSRYVWDISAAWPPFGWVCGIVVGFLACHFWWGGVISFPPKPGETS